MPFYWIALECLKSRLLPFEEPVNKRCNPADHYVPAKLRGRAEESCANCSWIETVSAIAILLFNASKFLGSLFYSHLTFIQAEPDSERQV